MRIELSLGVICPVPLRIGTRGKVMLNAMRGTRDDGLVETTEDSAESCKNTKTGDQHRWPDANGNTREQKPLAQRLVGQLLFGPMLADLDLL